MKHTTNRIIRTATALLTLALAFGGVSTALARPAGQVSPTNEWVNFYGVDTTLDGQPVPAGTIVAAYDPQGTLCGQAVVHTPGYYGLLACYRDDPNTPEDEGAEPGDSITFTMGGQFATRRGPDGASWTSNGALMHVELSAGSVGGPAGTLRGTVYLDADGDGSYDPGESPLAGVTVTAISASGFEVPLLSGDDGTFGFVGMRSGYWTLEVTAPAGYTVSGPTRYTDVWLGPGSWEALDKNFGLVGGPVFLPVAGDAPLAVIWLIVVGSLLAGLGLGLKGVNQRRDA